jgi:hypothetical protein
LLVAGNWDFKLQRDGARIAASVAQPVGRRRAHRRTAFDSSNVAPDEGSIENTEATISPAELFELAPDWPGVPFESR